ncbi:hypothetical protein KCP78_14505 [Salmonella enterica subsp. enterica]|nr:hypothetical protein KCP78_14505 [Salmonella enterica subsp. enterica]
MQEKSKRHFNSLCADNSLKHELWQITRLRNETIAKVGSKKTCASAQVSARQVRKSVPNNLTNQYLWDADCGAPARLHRQSETQGINGNATIYCKLSVTGTRDFRRNKNLRISTQVGVVDVADQQ